MSETHRFCGPAAAFGVVAQTMYSVTISTGTIVSTTTPSSTPQPQRALPRAVSSSSKLRKP